MSNIYMVSDDEQIVARVFKDGVVMFGGAIDIACYLSEEYPEYRNIEFAVRIADIVFAIEAGQEPVFETGDEPIIKWLSSVGYCYETEDEEISHNEFVIEWYRFEEEYEENFVCR